VEVVREVMVLLALARDPERADRGHTRRRLFALFAPDVHIDMSRRVFNPDTYDGHAGLRRLGREVRAVWDEFTIEPERFASAADRVVVIEKRRGRGRGSGVEVEQRSGVIWTVREGKIVRMETDLDPDDALKAVGLADG
jgi:ketosteroid isomerase-like protein